MKARKATAKKTAGAQTAGQRRMRRSTVMTLSPEAVAMVDAVSDKLGLSRSRCVELLIRTQAEKLLG